MLGFDSISNDEGEETVQSDLNRKKGARRINRVFIETDPADDGAVVAPLESHLNSVPA